ncbi:hypothetical protein [Chryseobacterium sp.]|uniref:hypothetical protein n=1 Tax=Chryseobacterium sp. TaxID=1871047 RepID=UPI0024E1BC09|nr:hypothetical protein [Chryseobacterium sp.]
MKQYFREHYIRLIFIISLAIGVYYSSKIPALQYFLVYFYIFIVVDLFPQNNITNKLIPFIKLPGYIFLYITPLFKSFYNIFLTFLIMFVASYGIVKFVPNFFNISMNFEKKLFIFLILFTSASTLAYDSMTKGIIRISNITESKEEYHAQKEMTNHFLNVNKIRFIIYLSYAIFFLIYSYLRLDEEYKNQLDDLNAVSYSFGYYIAFEKVIQNFHLLKTDFRGIISKLNKNSNFYKK